MIARNGWGRAASLREVETLPAPRSTVVPVAALASDGIPSNDIRSSAPTLPMPSAERTMVVDAGAAVATQLDPFASRATGAATAFWCIDTGEIRAMTTFQIWVALASGDIGVDARVWRDGMECWLEVGLVPELACAIPVESGPRERGIELASGDGTEDWLAPDSETTPSPPREIPAEPPPSPAPPPAWADDPRETHIARSQRPSAWQRGAPRALVGVAAVTAVSLVVTAIAAGPRRSASTTAEVAQGAEDVSATVRPQSGHHDRRRTTARGHAEIGQRRLRARTLGGDPR